MVCLVQAYENGSVRTKSNDYVADDFLRDRFDRDNATELILRALVTPVHPKLEELRMLRGIDAQDQRADQDPWKMICLL
jgi:hypothetical protein